MNRSISVRTLQRGDIADCSRILHSLPDWFGLEASNRAYIDSLNTSPGAVAVEGNDIIGFIALVAHTDASYEINVMAVPQDRHRRGIGSALIAWAEKLVPGTACPVAARQDAWSGDAGSRIRTHAAVLSGARLRAAL